MKLLFAHDHRFQRNARDELYTPSSFPAAFWDRYLKHFERVHVIARDGGRMADGARLARTDREEVEFEFVRSLASLRQLFSPSREIDDQVRAAVASTDAVVARLPSELGLLAIRHAKRLGKPYAVEVVGCAWDSCMNNGSIAARLYAPVAFLRNRSAIASAPLALYVTSSWLQKRYPTSGQQEAASNVALLPLSKAECKHREERLAAIAAGQAPVLGTIASLQVKWKGIQTALSALSRLHSEGLDLHYRIVGPGRSEPWQRLAKKLGVAHLVHFDGTRSAGAEINDWLGQIDIHLQPSFQEGLPRATIEAMSRGAACIGSTCGGIPELLPRNRVHRPGDVAALARHIRRLATNPSDLIAASREDLARAGQFDAEVLEERRTGFFLRLRALAERRGPASPDGAPVSNDSEPCQGRVA